MTGAPDEAGITLPLAEPISQHPFLTQFLPAKINPEGKAVSLSPQNSGDFVTPLEGTGYLEIPPGNDNAHFFPLFLKEIPFSVPRFFKPSRVQNKTELATIHPLRHPSLNDPIFS